MARIKDTNIHQRNFYKIIMSIAYSFDTGHKYQSTLRMFLYIFLFNWTIMVSNKITIICFYKNNLGTFGF